MRAWSRLMPSAPSQPVGQRAVDAKDLLGLVDAIAKALQFVHSTMLCRFADDAATENEAAQAGRCKWRREAGDDSNDDQHQQPSAMRPDCGSSFETRKTPLVRTRRWTCL